MLFYSKLYALQKRFFDIVFSGVAIVMLSPILLVVALLVKVSSRGPVFFVQRRAGLKGKPFSMYKFRTMVVDAEEQLEALKDHNDMDGPAFKMDNDPRVIKWGNHIRKHCLDELPQLVNVLLGDMSLVGPRPPTLEEVKLYEPWHHMRFKAKPGLTCYWQVENNRKMSFDDWVRLDILYAKNQSFLTDWKLIFKTIPVVLFGQH